MIKLKSLLKSFLLKENRNIQGEWWFQDGNAVYADGDVGDMNHEAYVIDILKRQILDALDVDTSNYDFVPYINDDEISNEIFSNIKDELTPEELQKWEDGEIGTVIISYLTRQGEKDIKNILYYIRGRDDKGHTLDPREYALVHWGWQRVKTNNIQTQTLTSKDLSNIVSGLYEAYGDALEETNPDNITDENPTGEPTFNIEVMSTRSWYEGIPISVLEKKSATALNSYRHRYEQ